METFNLKEENENRRQKLNNINANPDHFLSLTQFDVDLQQQAQFVIQQEIEPWEDFDHYLPPLTYNQIPSPPNMTSPNNQIKLDFTSPDFPPPFGSPDSTLHQQNSPLFNDQPFFNAASNNTTPLETPLESPKNSTLLNFQFSTNENAQGKTFIYNFNI